MNNPETEFYGSILIPKDRMADLDKAVSKLARRIGKGQTHADYPPTIEATREHFVEGVSGELEAYYWVTIRYQTPSQEGWQLVCVYDWEVTPEGERICYTRPVPGMMVLPEFREIQPDRCDHCGYVRRRKQSMLITRDFLDYQVVGTSCLKDFLGHKSAKSFVELYTFHKMITDANTQLYSGPALAMLKASEVVAVAAMYTRLHGFVKSSEIDSTATSVRTWFYPGILRGTLPTPEQQDEQAAADAIEYIRAQGFASDYIENCVKALDAGWVTDKRIGLLASIPGVWLREQERKARQADTLNEHRGEIKERLRGITAVVECVRYTEGMYGTTSIIKLRDTDGRSLVWFASGYHEPKAGDQWTLDGTVKDHNEFNGTKQTVLTRVKYQEAP